MAWRAGNVFDLWRSFTLKWATVPAVPQESARVFVGWEKARRP
jgi:hypothetical protein